MIKSKTVKKADPQMVSAAIRKINWHKVQIHDLEGELDILREKINPEDKADDLEGQDD